MAVIISRHVLAIIGLLALASLVPVLWAVIDVLRRPAWQFSPGRKVAWALTLGVGWLLLWPLALVLSIIYLSVTRKRLPPVSTGVGPPRGGAGGAYPPYPPYGPGGPVGPYGPGTPWPGSPGYPPDSQPPSPYGTPPPGTPGMPPGPPGPVRSTPYGMPPAPAPTPAPHPRDLPPAGWYADPAGGGGQRWWDGVGWTQHTRTGPPGS